MRAQQARFLALGTFRQLPGYRLRHDPLPPGPLFEWGRLRCNLGLPLPPFFRQSPEWPLRFPRNAFPVRSGPYRRSERPHWGCHACRLRPLGGKKNGSLRPHTASRGG